MSQRENHIAQAPIKKWEIKLLVLTVVLVILGCIALNQLVLGGTPHGWDGVSYYYQAKVFASGRIVAPSTKFIEFFWIANIINRTDKRFSKYTPGWPLILTPAMFLGIPFIANAALAGLCVALMWLLTRDLFGIREAWISVVLAATSPFFIFMGANYLSHMSSATALLGMLYALIKSVRSPQKQQSVYWAIMAGICALTAVLIRPYSGLLGGVSVIWITGWLVSWQPKRWVRVIVVMCVIGLIGVAGLIMYNKATTGAPFLMGYKYYSKDLSFLGVEGVFRNSVWDKQEPEKLSLVSPPALPRSEKMSGGTA